MMHGKWTKENFNLFHSTHPDVYELFKKFALQASYKRDRYSARGIFHRIRWETMMQDTDEVYKIDDGWSPHYARMFMEEHSDLSNFFETRIRKESYH
tara:strand:- start:41 stop:331 length:291 start_codon:yes stop_codon:yes gene_type:complete